MLLFSAGIASSEEPTTNAASAKVTTVVGKVTDKMDDEEGVTSRIFTIPNIITFVRLCMIPVFFVVLLQGYDLAASIIFAVTALTDCIDGYLARATHSVSKLGQILDPFVDRLLVICGALGLIVVGRLPIWIVALVFLRDATLMAGGSYLLMKWGVRVPVIFLGKVVTTLLFVGFAGLLMNFPQMQGLGLVEASWLPGFNSLVCSWGIWFVYIGLVLGAITTFYYVSKSISGLKKAKQVLAEQTA